MMHDTTAKLIDDYLAGPALLREAVAGMTAEQLDGAPVPGKWSTRQVVCHIADFEPVYATRMKRVIAESSPPGLAGGFHQQFAEHLCYDERDVDEELELIEVTRKQMARILRRVPEDAFAKTGVHSEDGPISLRTLLERITNHIPHHVEFIREKRAALDGRA